MANYPAHGSTGWDAALREYIDGAGLAVINRRVVDMPMSQTSGPVDVQPILQPFLDSLPVGSVAEVPNCGQSQQFYLGSTLTVPDGVTLHGGHVRGAAPTAQGGSYLRAMAGGVFTNNTLIKLAGPRSQLSHMVINGDNVVDTVVDANDATDSRHDMNTIMGGNLFCWKGDAQRIHYDHNEFSGNMTVTTDFVFDHGWQGGGYLQVDGPGILDGLHMNSSGGGAGNLILNSGGIILFGCVIDTWGVGALGAIQITANATTNPIMIVGCGFLRTSTLDVPFINIDPGATSARGLITGCGEWQAGGLTPGSVPVAIAFGSAANAARWGVGINMFPNSAALYDFTPGSPGANYNSGAWAPLAGTTRPTAPAAGTMWFDSSLTPPRPIWWTGSAWVDSTGTTV